MTCSITEVRDPVRHGDRSGLGGPWGVGGLQQTLRVETTSEGDGRMLRGGRSTASGRRWHPKKPRYSIGVCSFGDFIELKAVFGRAKSFVARLKPMTSGNKDNF
jgi:hypothetical protein